MHSKSRASRDYSSSHNRISVDHFLFIGLDECSKGDYEYKGTNRVYFQYCISIRPHSIPQPARSAWFQFQNIHIIRSQDPALSVRHWNLPRFSIGESGAEHLVTLAPNISSRFECRYVYIRMTSRNKMFSARFSNGKPRQVPVAHAEGRVLASDNMNILKLKPC